MRRYDDSWTFDESVSFNYHHIFILVKIINELLDNFLFGGKWCCQSQCSLDFVIKIKRQKVCKLSARNFIIAEFRNFLQVRKFDRVFIVSFECNLSLIHI